MLQIINGAQSYSRPGKVMGRVGRGGRKRGKDGAEDLLQWLQRMNARPFLTVVLLQSVSFCASFPSVRDELSAVSGKQILH